MIFESIIFRVQSTHMNQINFINCTVDQSTLIFSISTKNNYHKIEIWNVFVLDSKLKES